jgi:hypothetical protein
MTGIALSLRDGRWFEGGRIRAAFGALLAVEAAAFLFLVAGTHGLIVPLDKPTTTDFVSFYAAGALADSGAPWLAYDHAAHYAAEQRAAESGIEYQYFNYPPVFLLLCTALAQFPYLVGFMLFQGASLALWLLVATRILGECSLAALIALLAVPVVWWNIGLGQNAFLTAALFGAATLLIDRRPIAAGMLFGALCYKPQFGLLIPVALLAAGQRRAAAAAAGSAAALILASLAAFGTETWRAFFETAAASPGIYQSGRILFAGMANPFGAARLIGLDPAAAYAVQAAALIGCAAIVASVWRARLSLPTRAATLAAAAVVAAPLALLYDLMLVTLAAVWLVRGRGAAAAWSGEKAAMAVMCGLTLVGRGAAERWHVPVFAISALTMLALAAGRAYREAALRHEMRDASTSAGCEAARAN